MDQKTRRMQQEIPARKVAVRRQVRALLDRLTDEERAARSALACSLLQRQEIWLHAESVLLYAPTAGELDVWPLVEVALQMGKIPSLPRYSTVADAYLPCRVRDPLTQVRAGRFGIREPMEQCETTPLNRLDLVLVPGVAFDLHGRRLGRGKGHYDRMLDAVAGVTCGVAFDEQVVAEVPVEAHDAVLNCILTPTRWVEL